MPATKFIITGGAAEVAGAANAITITADDVGYVGDHSITFSGVANSPWGLVSSTKNKLTAPIAFGAACVLTFVAGVATTDMILYNAAVVNVACTDGAIVAAGADRLNVTVTAGVATALDWQLSTATPTAGTGFTIPKVDAVDGFGNLDLTYTGDQTLTFSNISNSPNGTHPTVSDKTNTARNFGVGTVVTFANGEAVTGANQLKIILYAAIVGPQELHVTDGTLVGILSEASPYLSPKIATVAASATRHFDFVLAAGQSSGVPFVGTNTLTAADQYENVLTTFSAAVNNVTVTVNAPLVGTVSGLGSGLNAVLNQAADFVNGVCNLTGKLKFTGNIGAWGLFTATQAVTGITGNSNPVVFNPGTQGLPIVINTVMPTTYQNSGSAPNNLAIYPRRLEWVPPYSQKGGPGLGGQVLRIEDGHGKVLFQHTASTQLENVYVLLTGGNPNARGGVKWKDFIVTVMEGGRLFIWYTN